MSYRLKPGQEAFEVVDGPDAGKKYVKGRAYDTVPAADKHRFERVPGPDTSAKLIKKMAEAPPDPAKKKTDPVPAGKPTGKKEAGKS